MKATAITTIMHKLVNGIQRVTLSSRVIVSRSHRLQPTCLCIHEPTCKARDGRPRRMVVGRLRLWPDGKGAQQDHWCVRVGCAARGVTSMNFEVAASMKASSRAKAKGKR